MEPLTSKFIAKSLEENLSLCLSELFRTEHLQSNYGELLKHTGEYVISITPEKAELVESKTKAQSKSPISFKMRIGQITASRSKSAAHTNCSSPSVSLIMSIYHPEMMKLQ